MNCANGLQQPEVVLKPDGFNIADPSISAQEEFEQLNY